MRSLPLWQAEHIARLEAEVVELRRQSLRTRRGHRRRIRRSPSLLRGSEIVAGRSGRRPSGIRGRRWRRVADPACMVRHTSRVRAVAGADLAVGAEVRWSDGRCHLAADVAACDRASTGGPPQRLWVTDLGRGASGRGGAGAVRASDHCLSVCRAVLVEEADRAGAGRAGRHTGVGGHGHDDDATGCRRVGPRCCERPYRRRSSGGFDETGLRVAGSLRTVNPNALGTQIHL
jgi:hypothetical protein